ncbi:MAG: HAMP domain-containing sensor histidine kinase [Micropepsaceae bacterium]
MFGRLSLHIRNVRAASLGGRYSVLAGLYMLSQLVLVGVCWLASSAGDATRAYATGEALFSKSQKVAVFHLGAYAVTADPKELKQFKINLAAAMGAREARLALQSSPPIFSKAMQGFARLGMSEDDTYKMSVVFVYFGNVEPVAQAVRIWSTADPLLLDLQRAADKIEEAVSNGAPEEQRRKLFDSVRGIDDSLTQLERQFGAKLREISHYASLVVAVTTMAGVLLVSFIVFAMLLRPLAAAAHSESRAKENEQRFRDFTEVASDWFLELDGKLQIVSVCGRIESETKVGERLFLGRQWDEILNHESVKVVPRDHVEFLHGKREFREHVISVLQPDQTLRAWSAGGRPFYDGSGVFSGYRITCKDISEITNANIQLQHARETAEKASIAKSSFLANMSHELRTPLNAIIGFAEIIHSQAMGPIGTERYCEYASDIRTSGQHLLSIISDILDLAKIESGTFEVDKTETIADELLRACQSICSGRAAVQNVRLEFISQPDFPLIHVDPLRIKQSLINLVSNAIKFSPSGSVVQVRSYFNDKTVFFEVVDKGEGMTPEQMALALSPFGQATSDAHRRREGTGLGLPITKLLVELHGGALHLISKPKAGTVVRIELPREMSQAEIPAKSVNA